MEASDISDIFSIQEYTAQSYIYDMSLPSIVNIYICIWIHYQARLQVYC